VTEVTVFLLWHGVSCQSTAGAVIPPQYVNPPQLMLEFAGGPIPSRVSYACAGRLVRAYCFVVARTNTCMCVARHDNHSHSAQRLVCDPSVSKTPLKQMPRADKGSPTPPQEKRIRLPSGHSVDDCVLGGGAEIAAEV
jgi:hypothetical protein